MKLMAHDIIVRPVVTEKSSRLMQLNKYTFEVHPQANKTEIRKAVETVFGVKVKNVHTMNVPSKPKRMGIYVGRSRAWKKAIVTLGEGSRIEFFEGAGA